MGWDFTSENVTDPKRYLLGEFAGWRNAHGGISAVVESEMVGTTWYAAIRDTDANGEQVSVWALVCLTERRGGPYPFGYKAMGEDEGPVASHCPKRILELLTPLGENASTYAAEWRARCERNLKHVGASPRPTLYLVGSHRNADQQAGLL